MDIQTHLLTSEAFHAFEQRHENVDKRFELHEGIAVEMPSPSPLHNFIVARIVYFLVAYLLNHDIGYAFGDNMDFDLAPGIVYKPDAAFVSKARVPRLPHEFKIAPDIAVEVVSPGNTVSEMTRKVETYLTYGSQQVWLIYPDERVVRVYRLAEDSSIRFHRRAEAEILDGGAVLPDLSIPVREIFPPLDVTTEG